MTFTTAGDPDLPRSARILKALDRAGADVLEVGVPFSDPLADGPVIQRATERALAAGGCLSASLALVAEVRSGGVGADRHLQLCQSADADGDRDVCPAGGGERRRRRAGARPADRRSGRIPRRSLTAAGLDTIFLLSPTTTDARIRRAAELGGGFLYGISRLGVTGARDTVASGATTLVGRIRAHTSMPIALGFGISRPEHVREVCGYADAAVVGSALVSLIAEEGGSPALVDRVEGYVRWLKGDRVSSNDHFHS